MCVAWDAGRGTREQWVNRHGSPHWLICADGHHLPVAAASLDLVIVFNALPHFDDRFRLFSEVARVLRPDGHFTIMHSQNQHELDEMHASLGFAMEQ